VRSYLIAEAFRGNDCNLIADSLVGLEIEGQLGVVSLNNDLGGLLHSFSTNATHDCGLCGCRNGVHRDKFAKFLKIKNVGEIRFYYLLKTSVDTI
jgi:hypothetical protein